MAQDLIRVGVIGTGFGAEVQIPGFQAWPETQVVAVCSGRMERAQDTAQRFGIPHAFDDYHQMLKLRDLDLISVVAPPYLHHPMTVAALEAGKHVLCEKPMAMNIKEARQMLLAAETRGLTHMIDHEFRFTPARALMKELIDDGYLGELFNVQITMFYGSRGDIAGRRPWGWLSQREQGGGFLGAVGSHYIDALRWWFGEVTAVCGDLKTFVRERKAADSDKMLPVDTEDAYAFLLRFQGGAMGAVNISTVARFGQGARVEAYGSEGTLVLQGDDTLLGGKKGGGRLEEIPIPERLTTGVTTDSLLLPFTRLVEVMARGIREKAAASPSFRDGCKVQEVMDALMMSSQGAGWVNLPLPE